ncbi:5037_t:CDS:2 [Rhizophagus irregularis]|nr:5037_t:CDS:2 [Rhizophagus irregularis]
MEFINAPIGHNNNIDTGSHSQAYYKSRLLDFTSKQLNEILESRYSQANIKATSHLNIRKYLQRNHNQLTWKKRIQIAACIIKALLRVHGENAIHRDLQSGNILLFKFGEVFNITIYLFDF